MKNISLLTVTCKKDFKILERQLISLGIFCKPSFTHNIILNDDLENLSELKSIVSKFNKFDYKIYSYLNFDLSHQFVNLDWWNQQILKLLCCKIIDTNFYLITDSKDYFTKYFNPDKLINNGIASQTRAPITGIGEFEKYYVNSFEFFDLNPDDYRNFTTGSHTPFIMENYYVKSLLEHLNDLNIKLNQFLAPNLEKNFTEFYLYIAWLEKNNIKLNWVERMIGGLKFSYEGRIE
jgi:hypothetical protein